MVKGPGMFGEWPEACGGSNIDDPCRDTRNGECATRNGEMCEVGAVARRSDCGIGGVR